MPPTAQRLREAAAIVLLAFGVVSTLFNAITFLFGPNGCVDTGIGAMTCTASQGVTVPFSYRALGATGPLLNPVVTVASAGAAVLGHVQPRPRSAKGLALVSLINTTVAGVLGLIALFASLGADRATGYMKTTNFFVGLAELAVAFVAAWVSLAYFQQHRPAPQPGPYGPPPNQWGPPPQQQWGPPPQQWGPPPQQWGPPPQQWGPQQ